MPFLRAIVVGVVTAALLGYGTVMLCLGEMAGPADFRVLLILTFVALVLLTAFTKPKGWWRGFFAGLVFALPIALTCFFIPAFIVSPPFHPSFDKHARELRFVALSTA